MEGSVLVLVLLNIFINDDTACTLSMFTDDRKWEGVLIDQIVDLYIDDVLMLGSFFENGKKIIQIFLKASFA